MDTVIIYPKTKEIEIEEIEVPYSILFVGSYISKHHKVALFDERITPAKKILDFISENRIGCVGISTMTGPQIKYAVNLSKKIKQINKDILLVWGGVHPTVCPESVIAEDYVDFVVYGEGEETFFELLAALEKSSSITKVNGIIYKKNGRIIRNPPREFMDINKLSLNWDLLNIWDYIQQKNGRNYLAFITSRGCPFRCNYCWNAIFNKRQWRAWGLEKTKKELEKVLVHGINYIYFMDDNINIDKERFFKLCEFLKEQNTFWYSQLRCSFVKDENLKRMPNCTTFFLGAESGSQPMLDKIQKDMRVEDIYNSAIALKDRGIDANYSWMMGFPDEKEEDLKKTIKLMDEIHRILPNAAQRLRIYNPYPGSKLFEIAKEKGFKAPVNLEGWANFSREYCVLDYIRNPWYLKCLSYVTYFYFSSGKRVNIKPVYRIPIFVLKVISKLRWKFKFFSMPIEFMLIEKFRKAISPKF